MKTFFSRIVEFMNGLLCLIYGDFTGFYGAVGLVGALVAFALFFNWVFKITS